MSVIEISKPWIKAHPTTATRSEIVGASFEREWMEQTPNRFAYRCLPMPIANSSGWELLCPESFEAEWEGDNSVDGVKISASTHIDIVKQFASSHFGCGILTFHTGYVFRTSAGWATWVRGRPNSHKENINALEGVVETDWLPFMFTMNWKFNKPGKVRFEKGESYCFFTLFPHAWVDDIQPTIENADQEFSDKFMRWSNSRNKFIDKLNNHDDKAIKQGWQKHYVQGETLTGKKAEYHVSKRKLKDFKIENI